MPTETYTIGLDDDGDIDLSSGNMGTVSGQECMATRVSTALKTFRGESLYDPDYGVDYFARIFGKQTAASILAEFTRAILAIPGVIEIMQPLEFNLDGVTRTLTVTGRLKTDEGVVEIEETIA